MRNAHLSFCRLALVAVLALAGALGCAEGPAAGSGDAASDGLGPDGLGPDARVDARSPDAAIDAEPVPEPRFDGARVDFEPEDGGPGDGGEADAGDRDAGPDDAGTDDAGPDAEGPDAAPPEGPAAYTADRLVSPLTPFAVARLRAAMGADATLNDDVFAKVGASSTVSTSFLHCFAGDGVDLAGRDELSETIDYFSAGDAAGTSPWRRESGAAVVGWSARNVLANSPSALDLELDLLRPRFAVVMYGTNDIQRRDPDGYYGDLMTLNRQLLGRGVLPVFSSIMPRDDDPAADQVVPTYNAIVRGVAQHFQVPFVDLHQPLLSLPDHGLGPDQLHCSAYRGGACVFTEAGLQHGYNWRNLLTIQALDRLVRHVLGDAEAPDPPRPLRVFAGTAADPVPIAALPFTDARDTRDSGPSALDTYPGCAAAQDESGPEVVYRLDLAAPTTVQAFVADEGDVDVDLHLLGDAADAGTCLQRDHRSVTASLDAGTWYFVVDSFVSRGAGPRSGAYLFVLHAVAD
jgi:hypothetical protein